eukprot:4138851-Amphidinium_carterae.1
MSSFGNLLLPLARTSQQQRGQPSVLCRACVGPKDVMQVQVTVAASHRIGISEVIALQCHWTGCSRVQSVAVVATGLCASKLESSHSCTTAVIAAQPHQAVRSKRVEAVVPSSFARYAAVLGTV